MTVNEAFEPTKECERVLAVFTAGQDEPGPWGRANPRHVVDETGIDKPNVEYQLRRLRDAGWIRRRSRGLYEFECDPREDDRDGRKDDQSAQDDNRNGRAPRSNPRERR